jgi:hypothetical protein
MYSKGPPISLKNMYSSIHISLSPGYKQFIEYTHWIWTCSKRWDLSCSMFQHNSKEQISSVHLLYIHKKKKNFEIFFVIIKYITIQAPHHHIAVFHVIYIWQFYFFHSNQFCSFFSLSPTSSSINCLLLCRWYTLWIASSSDAIYFHPTNEWGVHQQHSKELLHIT